MPGIQGAWPPFPQTCLTPSFLWSEISPVILGLSVKADCSFARQAVVIGLGRPLCEHGERPLLSWQLKQVAALTHQIGSTGAPPPTPLLAQGTERVGWTARATSLWRGRLSPWKPVRNLGPSLPVESAPPPTTHTGHRLPPALNSPQSTGTVCSVLSRAGQGQEQNNPAPAAGNGTQNNPQENR